MGSLRFALLLPALIAFAPPAFAQEDATLAVTLGSSQELAIAVQPAFRARFGCLYPMTYRIQVPEGSSRLSVERRHSCLAAWDTLPERQPGDLFNGIEAVRFDYPAGLAHVSAAFGGDTDSLFLKISDSTGASQGIAYDGIDPYYDDRRAVVTVTADDWNSSQNSRFCATLDVFRSHGLYVTGGIITGPLSTADSTWADIQREVDSGYVEIASHSRTHVPTPYADAPGEVEGSADDIVSHLRLPALFNSNGRQYVYVWIAPYGDYDPVVDSLVGARGYLVSRLYDDNAPQWEFSAWNAERDHFGPIEPTQEIGAPGWGGGSTDSTRMNRAFDSVLADGGIYLLMWHPQVLGFDLQLPYVGAHLRHISGRSDIWYANLGPVYLYHRIQQQNPPPEPAAAPAPEIRSFALFPNSPNPLRSTTTIRFDLPEAAFVSVQVFDVAGRRVATLVRGFKDPGRHNVSWDARNASSGIYFCRLDARMGAAKGRAVTLTRKMVLIGK